VKIAGVVLGANLLGWMIYRAGQGKRNVRQLDLADRQ